MKNQESSTIFDKELAAVYNKRLAKFAPLFDALYLLTRLVLSELPANARILCVSVGTGTIEDEIQNVQFS